MLAYPGSRQKWMGEAYRWVRKGCGGGCGWGDDGAVRGRVGGEPDEIAGARFKSGWHRAPAARRVHDREAGDREDVLHKDTDAGGRGAGVRARRRCDAGAGEADMDGRGVREARHLIYMRGFARGCSWSPHSPRRAHTPVDEETAPLSALAHYHVPGESHCLSTETE